MDLFEIEVMQRPIGDDNADLISVSSIMWIVVVIYEIK